MLRNKLKQAQQSLQEMGIYGLLMVLQKGLGLLMLPITTRYLTLHEYGILESLVVIFSLCSLLEISAGALPRFQPSCTNSPEKCNLISSSLLLSAGYGLVLGALIALSLGLLPLAIFSSLQAGQLGGIAIIVSCSIALQPLMMWLRIERQAKHYFYLVLSQCLSQVGLSLWGLQQGWGINAIIVASASANIVGLALGVYFCRQQLNLKIDWRLVTQTLSYQRCLIGASMALFVMHGLDRLLLAEWLGAETLARYAIMIKITEAIAMTFGIVESWWLPRRFAVLQHADGPSQVAQVHQRLLFLILLLLLSAALFGPVLIKYVLPAHYLAGLDWLPLMLLALGFKLATSVTDLGCYLPNKPVWLARINIGSAVLAVILYYSFIPHWGVWGLIMATNVVFILRFLIFTAISLALQPLSYPIARLSLAFIPPVVVLASMSFNQHSHALHLLPTLGLVWLVVAALMLLSMPAIQQRSSGKQHSA